jgi:hypothetical protein
LLRSTLEKTLKANGYTKGNLKEKIEAAAADGVITAPRERRAHSEVRVLGNDVLHDEYRPVSARRSLSWRTITPSVFWKISTTIG